MWHFQRIDPVQSILPLKYVAFVGAGGKTSLIEYLANCLKSAGKTVAITTTTKIYAREPYRLLGDERNMLNHTALPHLVRFGKTLEEGKLTGVDNEDIERMGASYDVVLIEADGAKGNPLKYPADHEPVIPSLAERIYVIGGLDAIHQRVEEAVFRWELLRDAIGVEADSVITSDIFQKFFSPSILLKGVDPHKCCVVLNKYDAAPQEPTAWNIARGLSKDMSGLDIVISSVKYRIFYRVTQLNHLQKNDLRFYNMVI